MAWFYNPTFSLDNPNLSKDDMHHAKRVLRMQEGDSLTITNGKGLIANCRFGMPIDISSHTQIALPQKQIHLAIAPTKSNDRIEWVIEKAVEIGVSEITFLLTHHSERRKINMERYNRVAVAALKQSQQAWMPTLNALTPIEEFVPHIDAQEKRIAYCGDLSKTNLSKATSDHVCIAIGPEGDFSPTEVEMAISNGFQPTTLGETRLRTETAALVAVTLLNYR